ncbi:hypothetical protein GGQ92_001607 [Gracilibacillus halotolerans]|uniref:Alpha-rhamnosidase n=1 Tax=Gracilibacillus halotolerans TaxID=74386 RepID=A0A841RQ95_9BACI|nr:amylo-alpha-1,6-glucosidase [Gracilibacillus halotolerans]MBB6512818.1 hypothetical protein [Gracilibacillus halotolerans]
MKKEAYWIWYPGDWEVWLHQHVSVKREMRQVMFPPYWRMDYHYISVQFIYEYELDEPEEVFFKADGDFSVYIDDLDNGRFNDERITLPAGKHILRVSVYNNERVPSIYAKGKTIFTNDEWKVSCYDNQWKKPGSWKEVFHSPETIPSRYQLETKLEQPIEIEKRGNGYFVDFGKETFGFLQLIGIKGQSEIAVYYGESKEEAEDFEHCILVDHEKLDSSLGESYTFPQSRAFRYVSIVPKEKDFHIGDVSMLYEYLPVSYRGKFRSSNEQLNQIWDTSVYTFHLNTREFIFDGIKRDRWVWSGDSYQSFLMNYYSFFDQDVVKRTLIALRGKDPVHAHINTILDYSLYWFISMYDYYVHTADKEFIESQYDNMVSLMKFCLDRRNEKGMMEGIEADWVFVDWADIDNKGEVSTIQILLYKSLDSLGKLAKIIGKEKESEYYLELAEELQLRIKEYFWVEDKGGFVHRRLDGQLDEKVTKYPNMFALLYDTLDDADRLKVKKQVLLNDDVQKITTPYMRFFELAALCEVNEQEKVLDEILDYWGGMLDLGATSFWEAYDPKQKDAEHYEMYGIPYGKSLCHAWGASPIYLLGKYFLGVKPLSPGYETFIVEPQLGGLEWMEGTMPVADGEVEVYMDKQQIRVKATKSGGILRSYNGDVSYEKEIPADGTELLIDIEG